MNLSVKQKWTYRHKEQICYFQGREGAGEGWGGSSGLAYYYIESGYTSRSYCIAHRTTINVL